MKIVLLCDLSPDDRKQSRELTGDNFLLKKNNNDKVLCKIENIYYKWFKTKLKVIPTNLYS